MRTRVSKLFCTVTFAMALHLQLTTPSSPASSIDQLMSNQPKTVVVPGSAPQAPALVSANPKKKPAADMPMPTTDEGATKDFGGIKLGVGLGLTVSAQKSHRVASAEVINNAVRITEIDDAIAGLVLESHYFFLPNFSFGAPFGGWVDPLKWGHGPFVAIQGGGTSGNEVIDAYGLGWMIGFLDNTTANTHASWNLGIGLRVDPKGKVLADGFTANAPPPPGETTVRLKTVPRVGVMFVSSFSF